MSYFDTPLNRCRCIDMNRGKIHWFLIAQRFFKKLCCCWQKMSKNSTRIYALKFLKKSEFLCCLLWPWLSLKTYDIPWIFWFEAICKSAQKTIKVLDRFSILFKRNNFFRLTPVWRKVFFILFNTKKKLFPMIDQKTLYKNVWHKMLFIQTRLIVSERDFWKLVKHMKSQFKE